MVVMLKIDLSVPYPPYPTTLFAKTQAFQSKLSSDDLGGC